METNSLLDTAQDNWALVVTIVAALFAMIGAIASHLETRRQEKIRQETLRSQVDNASLEWGYSVIDLLVRMATFARTRRSQNNDQAFNQNKLNLQMQLTSAIERGRLFFPSIDPQKKGAEKDGIYGGLRAPILDALVFSHYELEALTRETGPTGENSAAYFDACRRLVASELQAYLDPRRRDAILGRYDAQRRPHREAALRQAGSLKNRLKARRPELDFEAEDETTQVDVA